MNGLSSRAEFGGAVASWGESSAPPGLSVPQGASGGQEVGATGTEVAQRAGSAMQVVLRTQAEFCSRVRVQP